MVKKELIAHINKVYLEGYDPLEDSEIEVLFNDTTKKNIEDIIWIDANSPFWYRQVEKIYKLINIQN